MHLKALDDKCVCTSETAWTSHLNFHPSTLKVWDFLFYPLNSLKYLFVILKMFEMDINVNRCLLRLSESIFCNSKLIVLRVNFSIGQTNVNHLCKKLLINAWLKRCDINVCKLLYSTLGLNECGQVWIHNFFQYWSFYATRHCVA